MSLLTTDVLRDFRRVNWGHLRLTGDLRFDITRPYLTIIFVFIRNSFWWMTEHPLLYIYILAYFGVSPLPQESIEARLLTG